MKTTNTTTIASINAAGMHYRELNARIRQAVQDGAGRIELAGVTGQRYIGTNLHGAADPQRLRKLRIDITGTPGNDLGMFLDGPEIVVHGNVMDGTGNTMNRGRIVVHGRAGDITGFSARGGEILVRDGAGYRVGIHMKEYEQMRPVLVIGGTVQDFLGEYLAGGVIIVIGLGLNPDEKHACSHVGTGMHGGVIFIRGGIESHQVGAGVCLGTLTDSDSDLLAHYIKEYGELFGANTNGIVPQDFAKLVPASTRPFKGIYAY